jgi:hypothetical protein
MQRWGSMSWLMKAFLIMFRIAWSAHQHIRRRFFSERACQGILFLLTECVIGWHLSISVMCELAHEYKQVTRDCCCG